MMTCSKSYCLRLTALLYLTILGCTVSISSSARAAAAHRPVLMVTTSVHHPARNAKTREVYSQKELDAVIAEGGVDLILSHGVDKTPDGFRKELLGEEYFPIYVNTDNPHSNLTSNDLKRILKGEMRTWPNSDRKIDVYVHGGDVQLRNLQAILNRLGVKTIHDDVNFKTAKDYKDLELLAGANAGSLALGLQVNSTPKLKPIKIDGISIGCVISANQYPLQLPVYAVSSLEAKLHEADVLKRMGKQKINDPLAMMTLVCSRDNNVKHLFAPKLQVNRLESAKLHFVRGSRMTGNGIDARLIHVEYMPLFIHRQRQLNTINSKDVRKILSGHTKKWTEIGQKGDSIRLYLHGGRLQKKTFRTLCSSLDISTDYIERNAIHVADYSSLAKAASEDVDSICFGVRTIDPKYEIKPVPIDGTCLIQTFHGATYPLRMPLFVLYRPTPEAVALKENFIRNARKQAKQVIVNLSAKHNDH